MREREDEDRWRVDQYQKILKHSGYLRMAKNAQKRVDYA